MSSAYTSFKATVSSSALSSGDDLCSTTLFPSMTNRFIACVSTPSTTFTPKSSATLVITAATSLLDTPGRNLRIAASPAVTAACMTSACWPVTGAAASPVKTTVLATTAM